ncbi:MAG: UDP-N-acetylmuramate dehydrogenase [Treponema sp.]|nr:UDP-N-acetylmuramate dehydrogenase [Treponema sp.]
MINKIKTIAEQCLIENPCKVDFNYNEPMSAHTTFKTGGAADCLVCLQKTEEGFPAFCVNLLNRAKEADIPVFILGGGANIVVSDKGIRGIVLDMNSWTGKSVCLLGEDECEIIFKSGTKIDEAADAACAAGLSGLEFLAGMPGTIGGAVWMNARCYGSEIADVVTSVECAVRNEEYRINKIEIENGAGFSYKKSPFQEMDCLILNAAFKLKKGDKEKMLVDMEKYREDRLKKGHYLFPCAGSAFKNNYNFGKPTGKIIDELGLKGFQTGGAQIAPFHGNIIINTGNAAAFDIRRLVDEVTAKVKAEAGFELEPEILFVGEW